VLSYLTPIKVKVFGKENIDKRQSYIVVSNTRATTTRCDLRLVWARYQWVMKKELRKIPLFGWACEKGGSSSSSTGRTSTPPSPRCAPRPTGSRMARRTLLRRGDEEPNGKLGEFKKGPSACQELKLPILPISVVNTQKILAQRR